MLQVSRSKNLKIPKEVLSTEKEPESYKDLVAVRTATSIYNNEKIDKEKLVSESKKDIEFDYVQKIPFNSNDLIVITVVKKLIAYVVLVTQKSPKKFRGVFVNRMQNYCLDTVEYLLQANFIVMDSYENKIKRENYQRQAIIKLKLLGYISMLAENCGCILKKQYKQISIQITEAMNLIVAWRKSDNERWKNKN